MLRDWSLNVNPVFVPISCGIFSTLAIASATCVVLAGVGWLLGKPKEPTPKDPQRNFTEDSFGMNGNLQEEQAEQFLGSMLSQMTMHLNSNKLNEAEDLGKKALIFVEKTWGKNSSQYGLVLIPLSRVYESKGPLFQTQFESCLVRAQEILSQNPELVDYLLLVYEKLVHLYNTTFKYNDAEKYALANYEKRKEFLKKQRYAGTIEAFCSAVSTAALTLSNLGKFKKSEDLYAEGLRELCKENPTSERAWNTLELFTNCLHQQGKTLQAIEKLDDYLAVVKNSKKEEEKNFIYIKILLRKATLSFTIDKFSQTECYLNDCVTFCNEKNLEVAIAILQDLASCYWEMGEEVKARATQDLIRKQKVEINTNILSAMPLVRSKYLYTLEAIIVKDQYNLTLRVNRTLPKRKEDEVLAEQPELIPRKLDKGFLEIYFENPQNIQEPIVTNLNFDKFQFAIQSPRLENLEKGKWYEVCIDIYEDETKTSKLGSHHQMVLCLKPNQ